MNHAFLIGVVFALLFTGRTNGQTPQVPSYTGEQLLHDCTENDDSPEQTWHCIGFIEGVWAGATWITYADKPKKPRFVLPEGSRLGDVTEVVIKFLKEHPKDLHFDAGVLVISALENGFPPKKR